MPKPIKFTYEKRISFRDAFFFIIVCEGQNREPDYFSFFDGISPRVKIVAIETAIIHSKAVYRGNGYFPEPGSTQLWKLGEELLPLIKKDLAVLKSKFPMPVLL